MIATNTAGDTSVAAAYEQLRSGALAGSTSTSGGHFGLVVLMREGIAAWMARRSTRATTSATPEASVVDRQASLALDDFHAGVVRVLASMALGAREEMTA